MLFRSPAGTHDHFDMVTSQGILRLNDPRRFGAVVFAESQDAAVAQKLLGGLGLEPLSDAFTFEALRAGLRASRAPIKQVLLGGKVVVGVGNIYASEVLFLAGIRPTVAAAAIGDVRMRRLHQAIRDVLALAVERGGSTLRNFSSAAGNPGHFQLAARVYGRAGAPWRPPRHGRTDGHGRRAAGPLGGHRPRPVRDGLGALRGRKRYRMTRSKG